MSGLPESGYGRAICQQVFELQLGVDYAVMIQDAHYLGTTFREYLGESFAHHDEGWAPGI